MVLEILALLGILLFIFVAMLVVAVIIFCFIFWILMIVDAAKRDFKTDGEKIAWVIIVVFLHILGALIYYFAVKRQNKKVVKKEVKKRNISKKIKK